MFNLDQAAAANPWWSVNPWVETDLELSAARRGRFVWDPLVLAAADLTDGGVLTLRGPGGVGKSTLARRLIAERSNAGLGRRTCLLTPHLVTSPEDLGTAIEVVLRLWPEGEGRWLFVLDELTSLSDWAGAVAGLREYNGRFRLSSVLAVGSSSDDLTDSATVLAPWRGRTTRPDRWLLPATFRQYLAARNPDRILPPGLSVSELMSNDGRDQVTAMIPRAKELDQYLQEYARSGGMPRRLSEQLEAGSPSEESTRQLWACLAKTVTRAGRREVIAQKLLVQSLASLGSMTRWGDIRRAMKVAKSTVSAYIELLSEAFGLLVLHQPDPRRGGAPSLTKPRKVYFGDTGFAAVAALGSGPAAGDAALVENLLALALFRAGEPNPMKHFNGPRSLFTWKSVNGRTVDFLLETDRPTPIESMYGVSPGGKDYECLTKAFGRGIIVSRLISETSRPVMTVPAAVLLALLAERPATEEIQSVVAI